MFLATYCRIAIVLSTTNSKHYKSMKSFGAISVWPVLFSMVVSNQKHKFNIHAWRFLNLQGSISGAWPWRILPGKHLQRRQVAAMLRWLENQHQLQLYHTNMTELYHYHKTHFQN
ncbi:unnamed protein product [Heterosigma akashiwo]